MLQPSLIDHLCQTPAMNRDRLPKPWQRQSDQPPAYPQFLIFLMLGPSRSLAAAYRVWSKCAGNPPVPPGRRPPSGAAWNPPSPTTGPNAKKRPPKRKPAPPPPLHPAPDRPGHLRHPHNPRSAHTSPTCPSNPPHSRKQSPPRQPAQKTISITQIKVLSPIPLSPHPFPLTPTPYPLSTTCITSRRNRPGTRPIPQILVRTFPSEKKRARLNATKRDQTRLNATKLVKITGH